MSNAIDHYTGKFLRFKRSGTMAWFSKRIHSPCSAGLAYLFSVNAGKMCIRDRLKAKAAKIPPKIRVFSFLMLMCFMLTYIVIIVYQIINSLGSLF